MIHPSSLVDPNSKPSGPWFSNQVINTKNLRKIVLYQCNPSAASHQMNHSLLNAETGTVIATENIRMPPFGTRYIDFNLSVMKDLPERLIVGIDTLPSDNSKPMLCRVYDEGKFSMSHS